ncbi:MAG: 30S ribosomal protein S19e, partial [Methanobacteriota archaeon]
MFLMTTAYDVPPVLLIERLKEKLQSEGKIKPPEWASFAR